PPPRELRVGEAPADLLRTRSERLDHRLEAAELDTGDRGSQLGDAEVRADERVVVLVAADMAGRRGELAALVVVARGPPPHAFVVRHERAALAAGDVLLEVEAVRPDIADRADRRTSIRDADRLRRVLEDSEPALLRDLA